jgi:hypothetical protein
MQYVKQQQQQLQKLQQLHGKLTDERSKREEAEEAVEKHAERRKKAEEELKELRRQKGVARVADRGAGDFGTYSAHAYNSDIDSDDGSSTGSIEQERYQSLLDSGPCLFLSVSFKCSNGTITYLSCMQKKWRTAIMLQNTTCRRYKFNYLHKPEMTFLQCATHILHRPGRMGKLQTHRIK